MNRNYERITNQIIKQLERGVVPWRRPWLTAHNMVSAKPYRGVNALLLSTLGLESPWWLTYQQAQQLGGNVRKGERGVRVIFWKPPPDEEEERRPPVLKSYTVFNAEQCEGIEAPATPERLADSEGVIERMQNPPTITTGARASYNAKNDTVIIPALGDFESSQGYYATLFHELAHASGHRERLNREGVTGTYAFGSTKYAKEELVAEIGAAFLCGETGITPQTIESNTAYIAGWLKVLEAQPNILVQAAAAAQKATDHILNREEKQLSVGREDTPPADHNEERSAASNSPLAA